MEGGEQKVQLFPDVLPKEDDIPVVAKSLTIKTTDAGSRGGSDWSIPSSPYPSSPFPPSSAFVSALQSPYISPRVAEPPPHRETPEVAAPSPASRTGGFRSEDTDAPTSASRTPPSERYGSRSQGIDLCRSSDGGGSGPAPRVSFSFPVPRVSLTRGAVASPMSSGKLRSCDVYIGFHGQGAPLARFCRWLKAELELQGIASFMTDRARYSGAHSHEIADRIICSAAFGIVVVTVSSFLNPFVLEEIRFFAQKRNLVPILFDTRVSDIAGLFDGKPEDKEGMEAFEGLVRCHELKLETDGSSWRRCVSRVVTVLQSKLGRGTLAEKESEELPFPRNRHFVGREKELVEIEGMFFGCSGDVEDLECSRSTMLNCETSGVSDGFADKESDAATTSNGEFSSVELHKCKQPMSETLVDLAIEPSSVKGRSLQKERSKHRKSRFRCDSKDRANGNVICINGISGIGKTELALEFAYRYSQRYKMVLWIGGEARYLRQNILNLSRYLRLDISAEAEKEHGRIRCFEEQELDAFQRVKRELFRDVPYLLIIDNLENERDWWEGKELQDFLPRSTGASHVIVTTRLPRVINLEPMHLPQLSFHDAMVLMKGKKKDYPHEELEVLKKFDEQLERLSFGLWLVGSLLSELMIDPGILFEAVDRVSLNENMIVLCTSNDNLWQNNLFLIKVLVFCFALLDQVKGGSLALRMITVGSWLAPSPMSSTLLAAMASKLPTKSSSIQLWTEALKTALLCGTQCFLTPQVRKSEAESAHLLVKLGLARKATQHPGCWIQFHPIVQLFGKITGSLAPATAAVSGVIRTGNISMHSDHMWASAFLLFGFKSEPPVVQLKAADLVLFIKKVALPLSIQAFMTFSRCSSALELLKVCTNVLEDAEKSIASRLQDLKQGSLCWKKKLRAADNHVDEFVWHEMTMLKATLLETRAKLLMRGGLFDSAEELCRTCISIRTVVLGHDHVQTLAAQETLAKVVRYRSKI